MDTGSRDNTDISSLKTVCMDCFSYSKIDILRIPFAAKKYFICVQSLFDDKIKTLPSTCNWHGTNKTEKYIKLFYNLFILV